MSERTLMGMSNEEFEQLIEQYIERGSRETDDLDADMFFDALADFVAAPSEVTIELSESWHEGQLSLMPEGSLPPEVEVHGNRIIAPGFTFVIRPQQGTAPPDELRTYSEFGPKSPIPTRYPTL